MKLEDALKQNPYDKTRGSKGAYIRYLRYTVDGWYSKKSEETGVSREWAKYHARCKGCTAGQKVICKECRIKQRIKKCSLQKKWGAAGMDGGACLGFSHDGDDEPIERCKRCIACTSFDWDEEKERLKL